MSVFELVLSGVAFIKSIKPSYDFLVTAKGAYDSYQQKRTALFIEDAFRGTKDVTIHDVHKNDILHNFYLTLDCIQKVRKQEQLNHLAEILQTYLQDDRLQLPLYDDNVHNSYELILNLLTSLSYVEFELLIMLYKYEKPYHDVKQQLAIAEYWDNKFIPEAIKRFGLENNVICDLFQKLYAKGLVDIKQPTWDDGVKVRTLTDMFILIISHMPSVK